MSFSSSFGPILYQQRRLRATEGGGFIAGFLLGMLTASYRVGGGIRIVLLMFLGTRAALS